MMDILEKIVRHKHKEVAERKSLYPLKLLEKSIYFQNPCVSLEKYILLEGKSGIIAEIKRKSPSKSDINPQVSVELTSVSYMEAGASALSVLTDKVFFGGSNDDLTTARKFNVCSILRKDFIIDEYQVIEAKSIGADAILLIAAILEPIKLKSLCDLAHSLQLEVLLEVHDENELKSNIESGANVIGINNRNLRTLEVNLNTSSVLGKLIPNEITKISESGIDTPEAVLRLKREGFDGFLIGELFMRSAHPGVAAMEFIKELNRLDKKVKMDAAP